MQVFILSENALRVGLIEREIEPHVSESIHSAAFPANNPDSLVSMTSMLESSGVVIADLCDGLSNLRSWQIGLCFGLGLPIVLYGNCPKDFPVLLHAVTLASTPPELRSVIYRLSQALKSGQEPYAEVATELHMKFLESMK